LKSNRSLFGFAALVASLAAFVLPAGANAQGVTVLGEIAVEQTDLPDPVTALQELTYQVTVTNNGPGVAIVGVTIDTPFGSDVVEVSDPTCRVSSRGQILCDAFPALLPGGKYEVDIITRPRQVGTITNKVSVTPLLPSLDPDLANNVSEETTTVLRQNFTKNCRGRTPTIIGDEDGGVIRGTPGDDVIVGLDGNDKIRGGPGKDRICGQGGDDEIKGGAGVDNLKGGAGDDEITGNAGNDKLAGSAGNDRISGGDGNDRIRESGGEDVAKGGAGDDRITGGAANDVLNGAGGDDRIAGQGGDDDVNGRSGDDTLTGGGGNNAIDGGAGKDSCRGNGAISRCERT
jgi:hypothetical protein